MTSSNGNVSTPVSFPFPSEREPPDRTNATTTPQRRSRTSTTASSTSSRIRAASIKLMEASPPPGMWAATGTVASQAPTLAEIRRGSFGSASWRDEQQKHRRQRHLSQGEGSGNSGRPRGGSSQTGSPISPTQAVQASSSPGTASIPGSEPFPVLTEEELEPIPSQKPGAITAENIGNETELGLGLGTKESTNIAANKEMVPEKWRIQRQYSNGYIPPPKIPWTRATAIGLKAFWKWFLTPAGFLITIYGLNVVAWGGMLFLLLCNAAPAMCNPTCDDIQSPRRIWIEIDSQILNALFCVTGFGLAPWRFRDLYWWGWWRLGGVKRRRTGIRRLAGIHRGWFRLPGSEALFPEASAKNVSPEDPAVPIPVEKMPDPPPTGIHAPPTKSWKMDFVLWMNVWNTFFQVVLCFYMWHYSRHDRPSWATGLFVALGCIVAGLGGIMIYYEGKHVKKVEGVPIPKGYEDRYPDAETSA